MISRSEHPKIMALSRTRSAAEIAALYFVTPSAIWKIIRERKNTERYERERMKPILVTPVQQPAKVFVAHPSVYTSSIAPPSKARLMAGR